MAEAATITATRVPLSSRTTFDDSSPTYITHASAPFLGTFRPEQPLSMFNGKSGASVNGTWKLRIQDSFAGDTGTLVCWSLNVNQTAPPYPPNVAVFRPSTGRWFFSGLPSVDWGGTGDMPVPGDYNGDGIRDVAVFRPSNGTWYVNGGATVVWGAPGDIPVPADYDGDHITDMAVFRPSAGIFYVRNVGAFTWGLPGDLPVVGDYNGDGFADVAVYRPSNGTWYIRDIGTFVYGFAADIPVPADYDGNGVTDIAVFRPADRDLVDQGISEHRSGGSRATCRCRWIATATGARSSASSAARPACGSSRTT